MCQALNFAIFSKRWADGDWARAVIGYNQVFNQPE
jgi:hypothetical protein